MPLRLYKDICYLAIIQLLLLFIIFLFNLIMGMAYSVYIQNSSLFKPANKMVAETRNYILCY